MFGLITGGNAGLGFETAKELCKLGYNIIITARSASKGIEAVELIRKDVPTANIDYMVLQLESLASVREFASQYKAKGLPLHLLINNAGIMNTPYKFTVDGFEEQFQVNHLSHFLLTHYLLPSIISSGGGRVVSLSSRAHIRYNKPIDFSLVTTFSSRGVDGWELYGLSKLSNILFTKKLAAVFPYSETKVTFNSLHPGLVDTKLLNTAPGMKGSSIPVSEGIKTTLYLATSPDVIGITGEYFSDCKKASDISSFAQSVEEAEKLWKVSLDLVGLSPNEYGR